MSIIENIEQRRKCGEIYVTERETFDFLCVLCEESVFEEIERFVEHVKNCQHKLDEYVSNLDLQSEDPLESDPEYKFVNCSNNQLFITEDENEETAPDKSNKEDFECTKEDTENAMTFSIENIGSEGTSEKKLATTSKESNDKDIFQCNICYRTYVSKSSLQRHLNERHNTSFQRNWRTLVQLEYSLDDKTLQNEEQEADGNRNGFSCDYCNRTYALKSSVQRHIRTKHSKNNSGVNIISDGTDQFINQVFLDNRNDDTLVTSKSVIPEALTEPNIYDYDDTENENEEILDKCNKEDSEWIRTEVNEDPTELPTENEEEENSKKTFSCNCCHRTYFLKSSLQRHFKRTHKIGKNQQSNLLKTKDYCLSEVPKKKLKPVPVEMQCEFCSKIYSLKSSLHSHVLRKHKSEMFQCDSCLKKFISKKLLEKHKIATHNSLKSALSVPKSYDNMATDPINDDEKIIIQTTELADPLTCRYCFKRCKSKIERVEHEYTHTLERPYKCEACGKCFQYSRNYRTHLRIHLNERKYKCDICSSSFNDISNLHVHIRRHKGEKRFKCSYCEKRFVATSERKFHERSHTGERPYQCQLCGKCFTTSSKLSSHNKRHAGLKPHKCNNCDKRFYIARLLKDHMLVHTGEKPFICTICNAAFASKSTFKSHEKLHSDVRGYVCEICGESFKQNAGLYSHKKIHGLPLNKVLC